MQWFQVPKEEPSIIFPNGAVIEDPNGVYKILSFEKQDKIHKYKVEILEQKIPFPTYANVDPKNHTYIVLAQNLSRIKRKE